jgi:RND family efflux transporter MFP subunit
MSIKKPRLFLSIFLSLIVLTLVLKTVSNLFLASVFKSIVRAPVAVSSKILEKQDWLKIVHIPGNIVSKDEIMVMSKAPGFLEEIAVSSGQVVEKGQLLFSLENKEQYFSLEKGKQGRDLAQNSYLRIKDLYEQSMIAQERYDESLTRWQQAEAQVNYLETLYNNTKIYAPFAGVIDYVTLSPGQFVQAGIELFKLTALPPYEVEFTLPQELFSKVFVDDAIFVRLEGKEYQAYIVDIKQSIDESTRRFDVRALMTQEDQTIAIGKSASVSMEITDSNRKAFVLPLEQIDFTPLGPTLWTYEKNSEKALIARAIPIKIIDQSSDLCVIESNELYEAMPVIIEGFQKLSDQATIKILKNNSY